MLRFSAYEMLCIIMVLDSRTMSVSLSGEQNHPHHHGQSLNTDKETVSWAKQERFDVGQVETSGERLLKDTVAASVSSRPTDLPFATLARIRIRVPDFS